MWYDVIDFLCTCGVHMLPSAWYGTSLSSSGNKIGDFVFFTELGTCSPSFGIKGARFRVSDEDTRSLASLKHGHMDVLVA